jgi:oligoribonuclease
VLEKNLIWIDLEMTGLDPDNHVIIEIASIVTDAELRVVAEGPDIAIRQPQEVLSGMDEWNINHHAASGLLDRMAQSAYDMKAAEDETIEFLSRHCSWGQCPMCGNSIWQDRRFLAKQMPELESFAHYRIIDVSSIKELARRWYPELAPFEKAKNHLAMNDIKESIAELHYFRRWIFSPRGSSSIPEVK